MKAVLQRAFQDARTTIGVLQFDELAHDPFYILENTVMMIPAGTYHCIPYSSPKHPHVWQLANVDGRTFILIHQGNFVADTQGCLVIGLSAGHLGNAVAVLDSEKGLDKFRKLVAGQEFDLEIRDKAA